MNAHSQRISICVSSDNSGIAFLNFVARLPDLYAVRHQAVFRPMLALAMKHELTEFDFPGRIVCIGLTYHMFS